MLRQLHNLITKSLFTCVLCPSAAIRMSVSWPPPPSISGIFRIYTLSSTSTGNIRNALIIPAVSKYACIDTSPFDWKTECNHPQLTVKRKCYTYRSIFYHTHSINVYLNRNKNWTTELENLQHNMHLGSFSHQITPMHLNIMIKKSLLAWYTCQWPTFIWEVLSNESPMGTAVEDKMVTKSDVWEKNGTIWYCNIKWQLWQFVTISNFLYYTIKFDMLCHKKHHSQGILKCCKIVQLCTC